MTRRPIIGVGAVLVAVAIVLGIALGVPGSSSSTGPSAAPSVSSSSGLGALDPAVPTSHPVPGHEVFGFVPYWEMNGDIAADVAKTDLSTLALFSVTNTKTGALDTKQLGYKRITGDIGAQLIREAKARGTKVQLVFSSLGTARNDRLFGSVPIQDVTIAAVAALAKSVGVDGVNVDVEQLRADLVAPYGAFVGRLRDALRTAIPGGSVSVATTSGLTGAAMALAAVQAGADRIFLMGYDYHTGTTEVGASAPMARRDGAVQDLPWSLDLYAATGVPVERTILGLPLYGTRWRVEGPELGSPRLGNGAIWVPADNPKFLATPPAPPEVDPIEIVEHYAVAPTVSPVPGDSRATAGWQAIYVDSPATLTPKLALADERGLAGAGFWAIGYERGLPGYTELIATFAKGDLP
jgi:spore germination protein YaaH